MQPPHEVLRHHLALLAEQAAAVPPEGPFQAVSVTLPWPAAGAGAEVVLTVGPALPPKDGSPGDRCFVDVRLRTERSESSAWFYFGPRAGLLPLLREPPVERVAALITEGAQSLGRHGLA